MYKFGKRSRNRLKGVDSRLVNVLNELIKIMDVTVIEGLRAAERQEELLAKGATKVNTLNIWKVKLLTLPHIQ